MSWVLSSQGVLVLSPPRCGSSCLTACISFQGFDLGKNPATVQDDFNAKGYFENASILHFNHHTLNWLRSSIHTTVRLSPQQEDKLHRRESEFQELIVSQFGGRGRFIIKDPRIILLQSLYFKYLPDVKIICLSRDREAASQSMERMHPTIAGRQYFGAVWDFYKEECDALLSADPTKCFSVCFEDFLESPGASLEAICAFLSVPFTDAGHDRASQFIDKKLVRFGDGV